MTAAQTVPSVWFLAAAVRPCAWPKLTLENREGSPLLKIAAGIRSRADLIAFLEENPLIKSAPFIENLDAILTAHFGPKWWTKQTFRKPKQRTKKR